jgi:hypothetical protein
MASIKRRYLSYLLRLWQITDAGKIAWRASLEDPRTGERQGFTSLEGMISFLWEQIRNNDNETAPVQNSDDNK